MSYTAWSVVAGEIPTATKWNILGLNDDDFNTRITALKQYARYTWLKDYAIFTENAFGIIYGITRNQTVKKIMAIMQSGTATIRIKKKGGANIKASLDVDTTGTPVTSFDSTSLSAGDYIQADITAAAGTKLSITLEVEEAVH